LNKDLDIKSKVYAAVGIPEYWSINLRTIELIVLRSPTEEGDQSKTTLTQGEIIPLAFPDIAVSVKQLLGNSL
jgi:Uma2 family endonuclease